MIIQSSTILYTTTIFVTIFLQNYGHPCTVSLRVSKETSTELGEHRIMTEGLPVHHFVEMYISLLKKTCRTAHAYISFTRGTRAQYRITRTFDLSTARKMASDEPWEIQLLKQFCGSGLSLEGISAGANQCERVVTRTTGFTS